MAERWLIVEVGYFLVSLGNHQSDKFFCPSTLVSRVVVVRKIRPVLFFERKEVLWFRGGNKEI